MSLPFKISFNIAASTDMCSSKVAILFFTRARS